MADFCSFWLFRVQGVGTVLLEKSVFMAYERISSGPRLVFGFSSEAFWVSLACVAIADGRGRERERMGPTVSGYLTPWGRAPGYRRTLSQAWWENKAWRTPVPGGARSI